MTLLCNFGHTTKQYNKWFEAIYDTKSEIIKHQPTYIIVIWCGHEMLDTQSDIANISKQYDKRDL